MFVIEYKTDKQNDLIVFVSESDIRIPYEHKTIRPAKIADELNEIIGLECTGYERAEVSTEEHAYLVRGYKLLCHNQGNYRHTASEVRSAVRSIIETLKEEERV